MYNDFAITDFIAFIQTQNGIADKRALISMVQRGYNLTKDRSVFYGNDFAVRFCTASNRNFSNTVLSLSALQKYDEKPFIVCLVTPETTCQQFLNQVYRLFTFNAKIKAENLLSDSRPKIDIIAVHKNSNRAKNMVK